MGNEGFMQESREYPRYHITRLVTYTVIERVGINIKQEEGIWPSVAYELCAPNTLRDPWSEKIMSYDLNAMINQREPEEGKVEGVTMNFSQSGLCLVTKKALRESQVIKIDLPLLEAPLTAPTLAQVKWVMPEREMFKVGLMHLF